MSYLKNQDWLASRHSFPQGSIWKLQVISCSFQTEMCQTEHSSLEWGGQWLGLPQSLSVSTTMLSGFGEDLF